MTIADTNYEISRLQSLIPDQIREQAGQFQAFLEEYYRYVNSGAGMPSYELSTALHEHDIDHVSAEFLDHLQKQIAAYVPNSIVIDRVSLYKKVVHYYYNTRGSRDSAQVFFKIFFNALIDIIDRNNSALRSLLTNWLNTNSISSTALIKASNAWLPYSYGIVSEVSENNWSDSFKALVHPIGFKYFAILRVIATQNNLWADWTNSLNWTYSGTTLPVGEFPVGAGNHSPRIQPDSLLNGLIAVAILLSLVSTNDAGGRMDCGQSDYQIFLWLKDPGFIAEYGSITLADAAGPYIPSRSPATHPAQFSNLAGRVWLGVPGHAGHGGGDGTPPNYNPPVEYDGTTPETTPAEDSRIL